MILFSYDIFGAQPTGGVSRCMIELMGALNCAAVDWRLWVGGQGNSLFDSAMEDPDFAGRATFSPTGKSSGRWSAVKNEPAFARFAAKTKAAVIHRTYYPVVDLAPRRTARVETLHDMWDENTGQTGHLKTWSKSRIKRRALERADAIVCVSESTRQSLEQTWPWLVSKSRVIHHGVGPQLSNTPEQINRSRPYFLFVGRRDLYKNFNTALAALQICNLPDYDLIAFGGGDFTSTEHQTIAAAGLTERVHRVGGDDHRLAGLYESAVALLYTSAYEGFGLPLLEAMVHDCPVIASPVTSLPEVGGDAVMYADPEQPAAWAQAMLTLANDHAYADQMRARGRHRAQLFTWEKTAKQHAALYRELGVSA